MRISDYSLAQTASRLINRDFGFQVLNFPCAENSAAVQFRHPWSGMTSTLRDTPPQGPFTKVQYSPTATYPSLWNHNAKNETRMVCTFRTRNCVVRPGMEREGRKAVWATASRAHISREFRFTSQPLAMCHSPTESPTIGGRAWPNVRFNQDGFDLCVRYLGKQYVRPDVHIGGIPTDRYRAEVQCQSAPQIPYLYWTSAPSRDDAACALLRHLRRVPGQGTETRLPRGRRPQPRPPGPARGLRPARLRRGCVRGSSEAVGQVVRRAVRARRESTPKGCQLSFLAAPYV